MFVNAGNSGGDFKVKIYIIVLYSTLSTCISKTGIKGREGTAQPAKRLLRRRDPETMTTGAKATTESDRRKRQRAWRMADQSMATFRVPRSIDANPQGSHRKW